MSEVWKRWEGQVADHKYHLRQYLGSTDHSVVFLAEFRDPEPRQAAIKFISSDLVNAKQQLAVWNNAVPLSHPNLLRLYGTGRCKIEDMDLLYVAMEYAEENLAQVLPQRALATGEAREMLDGVIDVLVYLHGKNLAHGHIKPSNILAIGDLLKLSSDTIQPTGEVREMWRERSAYDAPELPISPCSVAADIWSLGVTLVEALTQQPAVLPFNEQAEPVISPAMPEPFQEIARHALRRDPKLRWSSAEIGERLKPATASKAATAGANASPDASAVVAPAAPVAATPPVSPLNVPLSKEPAIPLAKLQPAAVSQPPMARPPMALPPVRTAPRAQRQTVALPSYVVPLFAAVIILIAVIALPKILRRHEQTVANAPTSSVSGGSTSAPANPASLSAGRVEPPAREAAAAKAITPEQQARTAARPLASTPTPAPAVLRGSETSPNVTRKTTNASPGRGEVLDQILPRPSAAALATIQGTVRLRVKVHVDAAGNVSEAALDSPGSSKYFSDLSLKAVRGWVFSSPEADGRSVPSEWLIQFYFTQSGVKASAIQTQP